MKNQVHSLIVDYGTSGVFMRAMSSRNLFLDPTDGKSVGFFLFVPITPLRGLIKSDGDPTDRGCKQLAVGINPHKGEFKSEAGHGLEKGDLCVRDKSLRTGSLVSWVVARYECQWRYSPERTPTGWNDITSPSTD